MKKQIRAIAAVAAATMKITTNAVAKMCESPKLKDGHFHKTNWRTTW